MNSTNPADLFGFGTWEQITNRFLYCANSSGSTGGSSTLSDANLPSHTHTFTGVQATETLNIRRVYNNVNIFANSTSNGYLTIKTSSGTNCMTVIATETEYFLSDRLIFNYTPTGTLSSTGSGEEYLPPYMTVYAWYRTA